MTTNKFLHFIGLLILPLALSAQKAVPVKKEPVHVTVFKNNLVTIMYPRLLPGDTSLFHIHEVPSVFLIMSNTKTYTEKAGMAGEVAMNKKGHTWYDGFPEKLVHRVGNVDTVEFRAIDIELNKRPRAKDVKFIEGLDLPAEFERVRIYPLNVPPESYIDLKLTSNPVIIISYNGHLFFRENGKNMPLKEGDIKWVEGNQSVRIANSGLQTSGGYIYEIRK
jgi:hypothetical protein